MTTNTKWFDFVQMCFTHTYTAWVLSIPFASFFIWLCVTTSLWFHFPMSVFHLLFVVAFVSWTNGKMKIKMNTIILSIQRNTNLVENVWRWKHNKMSNYNEIFDAQWKQQKEEKKRNEFSWNVIQMKFHETDYIRIREKDDFFFHFWKYTSYKVLYIINVIFTWYKVRNMRNMNNNNNK